MALNDIVRVTAQFSDEDSNVFQWVWHYLQIAGGVVDWEDVLDAILVLLATAWDDIDQMVSSSIGGDTLELALWDGTNQQFDTVANVVATSLVGSAADERANYQDAPVVKFFTEVGRSIGKKFLFGVTDASITSQVVTAAQVTNMAFFASDLNDNVTDGGATFSPGNFNVPTETFREWTGVVEANALVGTQDRRRVGIGI